MYRIRKKFVTFWNLKERSLAKVIASEHGSEMEHLLVNSMGAPRCSKPCTNVNALNFSQQPCEFCTDDADGKQAVCLQSAAFTYYVRVGDTVARAVARVQR